MIAAPPAGPPPTTHEAIVTVAPGAHARDVLGSTARPLVAGTRTYLVRMPRGGLASLRQRDGVLSAEPNRRRAVTAAVADPLRARQTYLPQIGWTRPREKRRPVVAVLDTGVDARHPDLRGVVDRARARSFTGGSALTDRSGHGTHVAGIIAATSGNTVGGSGVSTARILPVRITDARGATDTASLVRGIRYAISARVDVINISLGGRGYSEAERIAIQDAVRAGIVVVAASGNGGAEDNEPQYPGAYPHVVAVAALTRHGTPLPQSTLGPQVALGAPGWRVLSTAPGGRYRERSGTSMSAAIVSGVAARVLANRPRLSPSQVAQLLVTSSTVRATDTNSGRTPLGMVSVSRALRMRTPGEDRSEPDDDPWTVRSAPFFLGPHDERAEADATLQPAVDVSDAYRIFLREGESLRVEVEGRAKGMDPDIWFWRAGSPRRMGSVRPRDLSAWRLDAAISSGQEESLEVTAPRTGIYTVEVRINSIGGPYRITMERP